MVGVVTGLAWTEVGGEILTIESVLLPGKGNIKQDRQTGRQDAGERRFGRAQRRAQPGDQLRHHVRPILRQGTTPVHVLGGAPRRRTVRPLAIAMANVDRLGCRPVSPVRRDVAMTGADHVLRGRVLLLIGGLKEKLLAALRAGIKTVFIPKDNEKDLAEIPDNVKNNLVLIPVSYR